MHAKTNQDEFAMGSSNENSAFGAVKNPGTRPACRRLVGRQRRGRRRRPRAVGARHRHRRLDPPARRPLRPRWPEAHYGAISRYGMIAFASSLDQAGPITRTVADAALMLQHLHGADDRDMTSVGLREEIAVPTRESLEASSSACGEPPRRGPGAGVLASFRAALAQAESLGARLEEIELAARRGRPLRYYVLAPAEASSNLSRFDGVRYGNRIEDEDGTLIGMYTRTATTGSGRRSSAASCSAPTP